MLLATTALTSSLLIGPVPAQNLPTGGSVAAGSVSIAAPTSTQLNITQTSPSAVVNWQGFSVGQGAAVTIQQPSSTSAILNRVTGDTPSSIAGSLTANGQVYLVNPNGIAITSTGVVNTGGGFVASTLGISDADFQGGKRTFTGNGASAAVSNAGTVTVGRGGFAALIGGLVSNSGSIFVPLGKVGLGSGERTTLDFSGDGFLQVALPTVAGGTGALIQNAGTIQADGGSVIISAATAREAARNAVNISGVVQARTIGGQSGSIFIGGGEGGDVNISGRLSATSRQGTGGTVAVTGQNIALAGASVDASGRLGGGTVNIGGGGQGRGPLQQADSVTVDAQTAIRADATSAGNGGAVVLWSNQLTRFAGTITARGGALSGHGGDAEVSGKARLDYTGFTDLSAAHGGFGTLLLDPYNVIISNGAGNTGGSFDANTNDSIINAATLQTALGAANVTITTGNSGSQAGNITVTSPLSWSAATTLGLNAAGAIAINAPITITGGGGLALTATAQTGISTTGLTFGNGASVDYGTIDKGGTFSLNGTSYTLVYTMAQLDAIDGVNAVNNAGTSIYGAGLAGNYALATNLNATGTTYTEALIGTNSTDTTATRFLGRLDGLGHTITGLTIYAPSTNYIGLIGYQQNGSVSNLGLVGGSVTGNDTVGALVGITDNAVVQTSFATTAVTGTSATGGLIGNLWKLSVVQSSYAAGTVTGTFRTGGFAGTVDFGGTLQNSYATGAVAGSDTTGGLVGYYSQSGTPGLIRTSYSTGAVTGTIKTGGLIGQTLASSGATVTSSYWDKTTSGVATSDGGTGLTTAELQGAVPSGFGSTVWGTGAGLYPYLKSYLPTGASAVSGIAYKDAGTTTIAASGASGAVAVGLTVGGVAQNAVTTGANGYYYFLLSSASIASTGTIVLATTLANSSTGATNGAAVASATGTTSGLNISGGITSLALSTAALTYSASGYDAIFGSSATPAFVNALSTSLTATGTSFTIDQAIARNANLTVQTTATNAGLTVNAPITLAGAHMLTLDAAGALTINAPVNVQNNVLATSAGALDITSTGTVNSSGGNATLAGSSFVNLRGADAVSAANGRWLIYSADPGNDTRGGLAYDFKQYAAAFGVTAVAQATGNGFLYSVAPTVTATVSKTYDGTTGATLASSAAGIDGDVIGLVYSSAAFDNANAGVGKAVTVNGLTMTSATNGGATVYGYTLGATTGTITPRAITVTADDKTRAYGDANPALTYRLTDGNLVNGDGFTGQLATTATAASDVGSYGISQYTLTAGSNYALTYGVANLVVTAPPVAPHAPPTPAEPPAVAYLAPAASTVSNIVEYAGAVSPVSFPSVPAPAFAPASASDGGHTSLFYEDKRFGQ